MPLDPLGPASLSTRKTTPEERNLTQSVDSYMNSRDWHTKESGEPRPDRPIDNQTLPDVDLMARITDGAVEALYDRYSSAVYSFVMRMLRDTGAAEEVTQDAFWNLWRRAASYRAQRGSVSSWLFTIAHHRAIDELRRRKRHQQAQAPGEVDMENQPSDDSTDPVRYADAQFQRGQVQDALAVLRPEQKEVVVLAYYGGLTHSEIAAKLDQPLGTVKTRMRLALRKLRGSMTPPMES